MYDGASNWNSRFAIVIHGLVAIMERFVDSVLQSILFAWAIVIHGRSGSCQESYSLLLPKSLHALSSWFYRAQFSLFRPFTWVSSSFDIRLAFSRLDPVHLDIKFLFSTLQIQWADQWHPRPAGPAASQAESRHSAELLRRPTKLIWHHATIQGLLSNTAIVNQYTSRYSNKNSKHSLTKVMEGRQHHLLIHMPPQKLQKRTCPRYH